MFGPGKQREFLLKLFCCGIILFGLSLWGWGATWVGVFALAALLSALHYNSTYWLLNKLDLGPEPRPVDDVQISPILDQLSKKYDIKKPLLFKSLNPSPIVIGLGSRDLNYIVISTPFFNKLSQNEKEALLELAIHKIESSFCRNLEFVTHINSLLMQIGSKMDLILAFIIGLKKNKKIDTHHHVLFSRISLLVVRFINYFYMKTNLFSVFDDKTYQNNPHIILALNKTQIYSPLEKKTINPLLGPFNFCNFPRYVTWHRHLEIQPHIESRLFNLQKDKNLMLESLSI